MEIDDKTYLPRTILLIKCNNSDDLYTLPKRDFSKRCIFCKFDRCI